MADIVFEREEENGSQTVIKLNDEEEGLLTEIEQDTTPPPPQRPRKRPVKRMPQYIPDVDDIINPQKVQPERASRWEEEEEEEEEAPPEWSEEEEEGAEMPSAGFKNTDDEKHDILNKLTRMEKKGHTINKRLNVYSSIEELRAELGRVMYSIEVDASLRFSRRMLVACVSGLEFLNKRYDPLSIQLDGWSESIMENMDDYDPVFEELYNKYKTKMHVAPEIKLVMMVGGSATMFHLTNSMFKAAIPNVNDIMQQNPQLQQSMIDAVRNAAQAKQGPPPEPAIDARTGRREMQGPPIDLSALLGGGPPLPIPTTRPHISEQPPPPPESVASDDSLSDIVSITRSKAGDEDEVRDVKVKNKGGKKKKTEINL